MCHTHFQNVYQEHCFKYVLTDITIVVVVVSGSSSSNCRGRGDGGGCSSSRL